MATVASHAPKALTPTQANALLRAVQQTRYAARDYAIIQMLLQTGLRVSECAALQVGDVQLGEQQGQVIIRKGKGNKSRVVPLNASARTALAAYLGGRWSVEGTVRAVAACFHQHATEPLWMSQKRSRLSVRSMSEMIEGLVVALAARELVPADTSAHTLRHTFATSYLKDHSGDLVGLASLLGHSALETTRIYVQPTAADLHARRGNTVECVW